MGEFYRLWEVSKWTSTPKLLFYRLRRIESYISSAEMVLRWKSRPTCLPIHTFFQLPPQGYCPPLAQAYCPWKGSSPRPHMVLGSPSLPHPTELGIQTGPRSSFRKAWLPPASYLPLTLIFTQHHLGNTGYIPGIPHFTSHLLLRPQLPNYFPSANPTCIYKERDSEGLSGSSRIAQQTPRKSG